jgi:hypothetical protein
MLTFSRLCNATQYISYLWLASLYNGASFDATVDRLNVSVIHDTDSAISSEYARKHKYPTRFS